jgi:hypothetical protein
MNADGMILSGKPGNAKQPLIFWQALKILSTNIARFENLFYNTN